MSLKLAEEWSGSSKWSDISFDIVVRLNVNVARALGDGVGNDLVGEAHDRRVVLVGVLVVVGEGVFGVEARATENDCEATSA